MRGGRGFAVTVAPPQNAAAVPGGVPRPAPSTVPLPPRHPIGGRTRFLTLRGPFVDTKHGLIVPFETGVLRRSSQSCRLNACRRVSLSLSLFPTYPSPLFLSPSRFSRSSRHHLPGRYCWRPNTHHSVIQKPTGLATARNVFPSRISLLRENFNSVICDSDCSHFPSLFTGSDASSTHLLLPWCPFRRHALSAYWWSTRLRKAVAATWLSRWTRP